MTGVAAVPAISGSTRLYAVLGDPVAQVRAPGLVNPLFARLGMDAVLVPARVGRDELADVVRGLGRIASLHGLLVTVPHKAAVCALADTLGPAAALAGSANVLRREPDGRLTAENFDGLGFVRGLEAAGHTVDGRRLTLIGGGGTGSAIAAAALSAGAARVCVHDVDAARLTSLLSRLDERWPGRAHAAGPGDLRTADLAVNATPLGLRAGDPLPFDPSAVRPDAVVVDIVMEPHDTALLRRAAREGRRVHHGIHMLEQQVSCYREFFDWPQPDPRGASR
ncbi:shikimate dehydrogenase family protein [Streptomyces boncukensis]|uniref:Shikimate dehydrogenase n=1 Tax=Streptomyces boncukensis TaxID=2711219 RepID=A0A6G4WNP0_9ACTN|nr:shikimate dehydrogenase [Streptomyces boncukensis]NGO66879.1 shikimate dehydrogenase [Streptomyces boncukensis]